VQKDEHGYFSSTAQHDRDAPCGRQKKSISENTAEHHPSAQKQEQDHLISQQDATVMRTAEHIKQSHCSWNIPLWMLSARKSSN
jgi:hypothetical protein